MSLFLFDTGGFQPRWQSGTGWRQDPFWGWVHISADFAIGAACVAIPVVLWSLLRHRRDLPFWRVLWLFAAFVFACGVGHLLDATLFWWPAYRILGTVKLMTAAISYGVVAALIAAIPIALRLESPSKLEDRVRERTQELEQVNRRLQAEISRRKQFEHSLRDREGQLRLVLDSGRMGTWEWDPSSRQFLVDDREKRLFGIHDSADRLPLPRMFSTVRDEDRRRVAQATERSIRENCRFEEEFRVVHPDGRTVWLSRRGDVISDDRGKPSRMIGVSFEVTDQRRADEALILRDRALQSATNGIVISDATELDLPIIYVNSAFELLTGYAAEEVLGKNCRFLQGPSTSEDAVQAIRRALTEKTDCHVTLLNYRKDGTPFWNDVRITPLLAANGDVTHFVGVQADITDRQEFEQTLRSAEARAQAASQAKSEFLANMSHEIRTPLTAVLGCADTLYPRLEREEHQDMVQMIRNQGRVLLGILNDILDLSKIEAGRLEILPEPCSIVSVIEEVRASLAPHAGEKGLELTSRYESEMPAQMETDPLRVSQILINLVGNAIKFTEIGTVEIIARCRHDVPQTIEIDVRDTGIGIPQDRLEAVFEAFSQEPVTPSQRVGGTGLGLTISQRLVGMLNGRISVSSEFGRGTTFTISMPIKSGDSVRFETAEELTRAADQQQRSRDSIDVILPVTILLAEDTRGIQFMIRRMLEDVGATVAVVENGERAVKEVMRATEAGRPFDVVLMDMQMPVMNGFEATSRLRDLGSAVPIIALTAAAMLGDREKCLKAGCDAYLAKPVDRHALLDAIARQYTRGMNRAGSPT